MEDNFNNYIDLDYDEINSLEGEQSNVSSRKTSISKDNNNRPLKKIKIGATKGRQKQSFVWNYFITIGDSNYCQVSAPVSDKYPDGKCNHKVTNGSTTTNMITHLKRIHDISNPTEQEMVNMFFKNYNKLNFYNIILIFINF